MNKDLNLFNLIWKHEGKEFYSPAVGPVIYKGIVDSTESNEEYLELLFETKNDYIPRLILRYDGKLDKNGELMVYPSKDNRDWETWSKNQYTSIRNWDDLIKNEKDVYMSAKILGYPAIPMNFPDHLLTENNSPIENSAVALMQIYQLIDKAYGGIVSYEEMADPEKSKDIYLSIIQI